MILREPWRANTLPAAQPSFNTKSGVIGRKIIIGKDTRISGYMLESALEAGLAAAGLSASFTGPMPTPAVAYFGNYALNFYQSRILDQE